MSSDGDKQAAEETSGSVNASSGPSPEAELTVTIGATVPTGFEHTAAEEVKEKIGADARVSRDRGRIYFPVSTDKLFQVHRLRSVDNLFVVVQEYDQFLFKDSKEETLKELQELASKLPWTNALEVWRLNRTLKKKKSHRKVATATKATADCEVCDAAGHQQHHQEESAQQHQQQQHQEESAQEQQQHHQQQHQEESAQQHQQQHHQEESAQQQTKGTPDPPGTAAAENLIKFRVTCNRAGDKHSFSSNEAARDFGGAVQEFFQWKADMTKFDVEVLLNIHNEEMVVGIALTEESLHRRNISHFGPTTLRSTLCYGMLRLCKLQASDIVLDPMCGTGAIPLEGAIEFNSSFYIAGDNNDMAVSRTLNNICHIQRRRAEKGSLPGLPVDTVQWDLCRLPIRTGSVDVIITDMPFGKRMGSRKKNWDLYPSCLREMARVCRPGSGKAVLLTQDKKCFSKAISRMGGLWKKLHTVWVNVGGLHAGVYLLKRTAGVFGQTPEDVHESPGRADKQTDEKGRH